MLFDILDLMESRKTNTQEVDNRIDKLTESVNKLVGVIIPSEAEIETETETETETEITEMEE